MLAVVKLDQLELDMEDRKSVAMENSEAVHVTFPEGKCLLNSLLNVLRIFFLCLIVL